jgi:hypothetical protein
MSLIHAKTLTLLLSLREMAVRKLCSLVNFARLRFKFIFFLFFQVFSDRVSHLLLSIIISPLKLLRLFHALRNLNDPANLAHLAAQRYAFAIAVRCSLIATSVRPVTSLPKANYHLVEVEALVAALAVTPAILVQN